MTRESTITEQIAKVESTFLGREDHGIMTAMLHVSYGGSGQGLGGYTLDSPTGDNDRGRSGTAYGMEWVIRAMDACGVGSWEEIKGRTIIVYKDGDEWNGKVIGFGPLPTERGKPFMFDSIASD